MKHSAKFFILERFLHENKIIGAIIYAGVYQRASRWVRLEKNKKGKKSRDTLPFKRAAFGKAKCTFAIFFY